VFTCAQSTIDYDARMHAAASPVTPPRIPLAEVGLMSREVAGACSQPLDVVAVMPTEGGGNRVEVFVALSRQRDPADAPVSVVVDRAVLHEDLKRDLTMRFQLVVETIDRSQ